MAIVCPILREFLVCIVGHGRRVVLKQVLHFLLHVVLRLLDVHGAARHTRLVQRDLLLRLQVHLLVGISEVDGVGVLGRARESAANDAHLSLISP